MANKFKYCTVNVDRIAPMVMTQDMAAWFITVAIPDAEISYCTEFDATFQTVEKSN